MAWGEAKSGGFTFFFFNAVHMHTFLKVSEGNLIQKSENVFLWTMVMDTGQQKTFHSRDVHFNEEEKANEDATEVT